MDKRDFLKGIGVAALFAPAIAKETLAAAKDAEVVASITVSKPGPLADFPVGYAQWAQARAANELMSKGAFFDKSYLPYVHRLISSDDSSFEHGSSSSGFDEALDAEVKAILAESRK